VLRVPCFQLLPPPCLVCFFCEFFFFKFPPAGWPFFFRSLNSRSPGFPHTCAPSCWPPPLCFPSRPFCFFHTNFCCLFGATCACFRLNTYSLLLDVYAWACLFPLPVNLQHPLLPPPRSSLYLSTPRTPSPNLLFSPKLYLMTLYLYSTIPPFPFPPHPLLTTCDLSVSYSENFPIFNPPASRIFPPPRFHWVSFTFHLDLFSSNLNGNFPPSSSCFFLDGLRP